MDQLEALEYVHAITETTRKRWLALGASMNELQLSTDKREVLERVRTLMVVDILKAGGSMREAEVAVVGSLYTVSGMITCGLGK